MILEGRGGEVVDLIREISISGRAPRQDSLLYALALCTRCNDITTRKKAYRIIPDVCRIPTDLFHFVQFSEAIGEGTSGWGRGQRKAISLWYNRPDFLENPLKLLKLSTKYKRRHRFSHKDVLRLGHVKPKNHHIEFAVRYLAKGKVNVEFDTADFILKRAHAFILALEDAKTCDTPRLHRLIRDYELTREHIPTWHLNSPDVWQALIYTMPAKALIRQLGKLSQMGLLRDGSLEEQHVISRLENHENLRHARIHPLTLLTAWNSYKRGYSGPRKRLTWQVNHRVTHALEKAFYWSFSFVEPTMRDILVAVDGTDAMLQPVNGMKEISARSVTVAMTFMLSKVEVNSQTVLVKDNIIPVVFDDSDNLESASQRFSINGTIGSCDPCMPIIWAMENRIKFDAIIFFTTSVGHFVNNQNISNSMRRYCEELGIPRVRFVNVGMSSSKYTAADPNDLDMLTVVGLDTKAAIAILNFIREP